MLNITSYYSNVEGTIAVEDKVVATVSANLSTNGSININKMITDPEAYLTNIDAVLVDIKAFEEKVVSDFSTIGGVEDNAPSTKEDNTPSTEIDVTE